MKHIRLRHGGPTPCSKKALGSKQAKPQTFDVFCQLACHAVAQLCKIKVGLSPRAAVRTSRFSLAKHRRGTLVGQPICRNIYHIFNLFNTLGFFLA
jgi:hypothetical protein